MPITSLALNILPPFPFSPLRAKFPDGSRGFYKDRDDESQKTQRRAIAPKARGNNSNEIPFRPDPDRGELSD
ncbi:hypothetical protein [Xanthomonas medicagonis]|uniref:hypothetical protein n=1 Tax=Xanthomonas medicagonis TaxID=3160841 RepID=UPI003511C9ED